MDAALEKALRDLAKVEAIASLRNSLRQARAPLSLLDKSVFDT